MVLTIERANAAPSVAGGAKADAAETMDSIGGVRDGDGGVLDAEAPRCAKFGGKDGTTAVGVPITPSPLSFPHLHTF